MSLFNYIKTQLPILDVVQEYTQLKKAGIYWKGTCPFHNEKTASFTVSPHKEIFYCFGCHAGGDVITFIAKIENCSPLEAAKHSIERYKLTIPDAVQSDIQLSTQEKNHYYTLCKNIAEWCHANLRQNPSVLNYLKNRGITPDSIGYFSLGYFPGGLTAIKTCLNAMRQHNFLADDLLQAHILAQGKTVVYSPFEERIIFPIKDHLGRFCGFGGRIFKELDNRAKYYNSRENEHFSKGALLFGLDLAKKAIQEEESAFLVEGYTDCIAMVQHGFKNTVATLGTACSLEHLKGLSRYTPRLFVMYDGDNAGQEAMLRLTQLCWQVNMELSVIQLPPKEDPASFLNKGNDLKPLIAQATDIFEFFIKSTGTNFFNKTLSDKLELTRKITSIIEKLDDPLKQDILLQKAAKTLDLPFASIKGEMKGSSKRNSPVKVTAKKPIKSSAPPPLTPTVDKLEKKIFFAIMNNIHLLNRENEEYLITYLPDPIRTILSQLQHAKNAIPSLDFIQFFDILNENDQRYTSKLLLEVEEAPYLKETFEHLVVQLQKKNWKTIVHDIKIKLEKAKLMSDEEVAKILHDFLELKKKMVHKDLI